jgi:tetratricopeptide (TPR) repeat protein
LYPEAIAEYQKAQASLGETPAVVMAIGYAKAKAGDRTAARKALEELRAQSKRRYVPALYFAAIYTGLGDSDAGLSWLEEAYREHSDYLIYLKVDPMADTLRSSPRFQAILQKIGIDNRSELTDRGPNEKSQLFDYPDGRSVVPKPPR